MVNCLEPVDGNACNKCEQCLNVLDSNDVIEIDAASNNGVDEIRELREKATLVPSSAKYKVYIIAEVHMLTTQAFNALLKTLEEPPKHVIFILATTEYYKIPLTITSRCQKFQFSKLSDVDIVDRLKEISKLEKIKIDEDALNEIARISDGGMRDSINFLDQLQSFTDKKITIDDVYEVCGNVSDIEIVNLLDSIRNNNCEEITSFFEKMNSCGKNYSKFLENFIEFLKNVILYKNNVNHKYINNDIECIKNVSSLYTSSEIFNIVESVNSLIDKLKYVSRQSVVVITNFLIIANKLSNIIRDETVKTEIDENVNKVVDRNYDMAFQFTSVDSTSSDDLTDNGDYDEVIVEEHVDNKNTQLVNENKEIIINNTFAVANKNVKINLQESMHKLENYLTDKKYKVAAGTLMDIKIEVAGEEYVIFSAGSDAVVNRVYDNYKLCSELLDTIFAGNYNFVILNQYEWNKYRDEYVENFKNGKKYSLKDLYICKNTQEIEKKEPTVVDKLFDLVGEDIVEFK